MKAVQTDTIRAQEVATVRAPDMAMRRQLLESGLVLKLALAVAAVLKLALAVAVVLKLALAVAAALKSALAVAVLVMRALIALSPPSPVNRPAGIVAEKSARFAAIPK
jgi:hypothetical protein